MAVVLIGNVALLPETISAPRLDWKVRHPPNPQHENHSKRDSSAAVTTTTTITCSTSSTNHPFDSSSKRRDPRRNIGLRRRVGGEVERRLKEVEEMKELERRAEELQMRVKEEEGEEETEEEKKMRVRRELEKVSREQAERRETAKLMFELGQKAYGRGMYGRAIEFLEGALTIIPRLTFFGGEIQIWLAMAYEANNRHRDCIALYQQLEKQHPSVVIRRQAADILYILQAPKLKISKDEMVTIPLIGSSYDRLDSSFSSIICFFSYFLCEIYKFTMEVLSPVSFVGKFLFLVPFDIVDLFQIFMAAITIFLRLVITVLPIDQLSSFCSI
ncbi:hypothetical protein QJS10_CPA06g01160 [Acorus calamus]|uniref:Uncharacterized protein n=1 Tax=Acorus calamus TaxID=4465 RepID=A0AAV9ELT9_ACOCL|nr:hypothetical protein QJS10_CPA06g01160 [Acorus calamus]